MANIDIVFYHSPCNDGSGCAYIIWLYSKKYDRPQPKFIGMRPNDPAPIDLCKGMDVVVADISWSRKDIIEMTKVSKSLIILDHHKTAFEELDGLPNFIYGHDVAGIDVVWNRYFGFRSTPDR